MMASVLSEAQARVDTLEFVGQVGRPGLRAEHCHGQPVVLLVGGELSFLLINILNVFF